MNFWETLCARTDQPYIIAEVAANHNGDMDLAKRLIEQAKEAGCDCVKFQSWTKQSLFTKQLYDNALEKTLDQYSMTKDKLMEMKRYCDHVGIDFACTPFSKKEVDFLVRLQVPFIKLSSTEVNNPGLLQHAANTGLPIVLSTGMSTLAEIDEAVRVLEQAGNRRIVILHCISVYPPQDEMVNLHNIELFKQAFPYPVGFSDHTIGTAIPLAAVAKGACVIEKHFTLDKQMPGWDHKVSANPVEMQQIVTDSRRIAKALGSYQRKLSEVEWKNRELFRRSIVAARDIPLGKVLEYDDLDVKRPGTGLDPIYIDLLVGKPVKRAIRYDELLQKDDV